ncbi:MAG: N,N-dimethylformamidase beta subunit family domain-containing protein [Hyphomicrobiaceae bacterium]
MLKLAGYVDRLSARPGETLNFKLSNATGAPVMAKLVRVISADPNPAGQGIREEALAIELAPLDVTAHPVPQGSCGRVEIGDALNGIASLTLTLRIMPTRRPENADMAVLSWMAADGHNGLALTVDTNGRLVARLGGAHVASAPLPEKAWHDVAVAFDADAKSLTLRWRGSAATDWQSVDTAASNGAAPASGTTLLIAAADPALGLATFDGRIENPHLYGRVLSDAEIEATSVSPNQAAEPIFAFDFAAAPESSRIIDTGPHGFSGHLVNHPASAMRSSRWTGHEMCFRHAPAEYSAIHFHSDDMTDCGWPTALSWQVPDDLASGCYALRVSAGGEADNIPFFIVPPKGKPAARIAVLVSTFTYTIYANHARPEFRLSSRWSKAWRDQVAEWPAYPHNPADHPEYAWSTYNDHVDGSGISISAWHRPMLNVRIGYLTYHDPAIRASGLRHYQADTHLHSWLEDQGYAFDIITDQELHDEGHDLLKDYAVVMTGSHPEYHTRSMLDALTTYRDSGGRLMYLGGNGFYWKVAVDPEKDGVIEIRRGEGGIRAWAAEPGEYYNQFDGEYGGLWRRNGRPPQNLCGVGFSAQGNFVGSHYIVNADARSSRAGWILAAIDAATFGGHGFSGHGAAGFELDRADKDLGTPRHAVILATSEGHEPEAPWVLVPEERLTHLTNVSGETEPELIRSDIVFFETPGGGAVFSVGSITYCGSLLTDGGDNDISRLTKTVLDRFADTSVPFAMPEGM